MSQIRFKKLNPEAILPTRANPTDAGMDLYALEDVEIPACKSYGYGPANIGQAKIPSGLAVEISQGYYGKISSRSGLGFNKGIFSFDGTIDSSYRGEIGILLYNTTEEAYQVRKGDKIAQLIIIPCALLEPVESEVLSESCRGASGFGSTGR